MILGLEHLPSDLEEQVESSGLVPGYDKLIDRHQYESAIEKIIGKPTGYRAALQPF